MSSIKAAILAYAAIAGALPSSSSSLHNVSYLAQSSSAGAYPGYTVNLMNTDSKDVYYLTLNQPGEHTAFFTGPSKAPEQDLNRSIYYGSESNKYGLKLPSVGDDSGVANPLTAVRNYEDGAWGFNPNGHLAYVLQAALDSLYLCKHGDNILLSYGEYYTNNGSDPIGCVGADIVKVDIEAYE